MKRIVFLLSVLICMSCGSSIDLSKINRDVKTSQTTVGIEQDKPEAVVANYNYAKSRLNDVLNERLSKENLPSPKSASNKFIVVNGARWSKISSTRLDYYFRVSGNKNTSTLEMVVSKGYENYISSESNPSVFPNLKEFAHSLESDLYASKVEVAVAQKEEEIAKAEKALKKRAKKVSKAQKGIDGLKGELEKLKAMK